ncbi:MAG: hypothetical protein F6K41_14155 [Symploca sp. SIO3E6]|nr:hypothetical protein [Caldora sp. SIO3E6]
MNGLIILVPYNSGPHFYPEYDSDEEYEYGSSLEAYLPVYVDTEDEDLALMAVANKSYKCEYVAYPSKDETAQEWEERGYPGTARAPGVDLPSTEEAYEIPEPGDCFCSAALSDYEVITPKEMLEKLKEDPQEFVMSPLYDDEPLWQEFDDWSVRIFNYSLLTEE